MFSSSIVKSFQVVFPQPAKCRLFAGAGILGGIGFTMSIFIANLAFVGNVETTNASKMAILVASLTTGIIGFLWLEFWGRPERQLAR